MTTSEGEFNVDNGYPDSNMQHICDVCDECLLRILSMYEDLEGVLQRIEEEGIIREGPPLERQEAIYLSREE